MMDWTHEMGKMLSVFEHQALESLRVIKLAFQRNGVPFQSSFKDYFLRASTNRLSETFDRFEIKSKLDDEMLVQVSDKIDGTKRANTSNESIWESRARSQNDVPEFVDMDNWSRLLVSNAAFDIVNENVSIGEGNMETDYSSSSALQINDSDDDEIMLGTVKTGQIHGTTNVRNFSARDSIESVMSATQNSLNAHNSGPMTSDDLYGINDSIAHQSNSIDPVISEDSKFVVEMDESNDSIELVGNQSDSTDADDSELNQVKVVLDRLDKTTIAEFSKGKSKSTRSNWKSLQEKRKMEMSETNEDRNNSTAKCKKPSSAQLTSKTQKRSLRCNVCGYVSFYLGNVKRHMRTHTGEKPHRCDRCGKGFASAEILLKHTATHIKEFPFHCRACFQGFSLKAEAVTHEKHCHKSHFECHLCKKYVTFVKHDLIKHMRQHTGDNPFRCEICMKGFAQKQNLKTHLNNSHA